MKTIALSPGKKLFRVIFLPTSMSFVPDALSIFSLVVAEMRVQNLPDDTLMEILSYEVSHRKWRLVSKKFAKCVALHVSKPRRSILKRGRLFLSAKKMVAPSTHDEVCLRWSTSLPLLSRNLWCSRCWGTATVSL